ncbi:DUF1294 domain-containing protein [Niallia taxi]|uniref:DUF1294 domain-containing protein n=1 Tax=Niallia taxi TaxID=2499688 RepID=UPI0011A82764|nr:DUF1294 domain-containing protein [Niallia taxi]MCT2343053.1 DUF1294 domain-containing protein [Niallia taxi]MED3962280.1 DUF1294 domain-containing protein [Niallia taxi]WOD64095.1 DUF1294 domain-containing protein [Niallia taxi]
MTIQIICIYWLLINLSGYFVMKIDKDRARRHAYRISEKQLWTVAFLFGALGMTLGMKQFRHKTKHTAFKVGLPMLAIVETVVLLYILNELA